MTPSSNGEDPSTTFATLRNIILGVAIYLYFTGFVYTYYFNDAFGISLLSLNIPVYYFFLYSYTVIRHYYLLLSVLTILSASLVLYGMHRRILRVALCLILIGLFPALSWLAWRTSLARVHAVRSGIGTKQIVIHLKAGETAYPKDFRSDNATGRLRLLQETSDGLYVLSQAAPPRTPLPMGHAYRVAKEDITVWDVTLLSE